MLIRIHGVLAASRVNGPGRRSVVHLQGCTLGCPACFNPETHAASGGQEIEAASLAETLAQSGLDGVTISGGEPFQQIDALAELCSELRKQGVDSIVVFSGYSLAELQDLTGSSAVLGIVDAVIAGRYQVKEATGESMLASSNQRLHLLTQRHTPDEFEFGGEVEITIAPDGQVTMTGFPSHALANALKKMGSES